MSAPPSASAAGAVEAAMVVDHQQGAIFCRIAVVGFAAAQDGVRVEREEGGAVRVDEVDPERAWPAGGGAITLRCHWLSLAAVGC